MRGKCRVKEIFICEVNCRQVFVLNLVYNLISSLRPLPIILIRISFTLSLKRNSVKCFVTSEKYYIYIIFIYITTHKMIILIGNWNVENIENIYKEFSNTKLKYLKILKSKKVIKTNNVHVRCHLIIKYSITYFSLP